MLDTEPASIDLTPPSGLLLDTQIHPLEVRVLTEKGRELPDEVGKLSWSATPVGVVEATTYGLRCLGSGDASVVVTGSGLSQTFTVQCRLVASIEAPGQVELYLGEPDAAYNAVALDENGLPMHDVAVSTTSSDLNVVATGEGRLSARAVGTATVEVRAGDARTVTDVVVMERLATETLSLSDGESIAYTLSRGRYRVDIQTSSADGSYYGVTVSSTAPSCPTREESTRHLFECEVTDSTSLVITNPTTFGLGPAQLGNISIYRIP
jgi:hypothetical protein